MKIKTVSQLRHEAFRRRNYFLRLKRQCATYGNAHSRRPWKVDKINMRDPSTFYDATVYEIAEANDRDKLQGMVGIGCDPISLTYGHFNPGVEASKFTPSSNRIKSSNLDSYQ